MTNLRIEFFEADKPNGFLSNFYTKLEPLRYEGREFASSEHLYQWLKFSYPEASPVTLAYAEVVRLAKTPNQSRVLALQKTGGGFPWRTALNPIIKQSRVDGVKISPHWNVNDGNLKAMRIALHAKFTQPKMRALLLETGDAPLAENSPYDEFWGLGRTRIGNNWLGKLLEEERAAIRASDSSLDSELQPSKKIRLVAPLREEIYNEVEEERPFVMAALTASKMSLDSQFLKCDPRTAPFFRAENGHLLVIAKWK
jgi:ribA/ribD-fused uncharacterized protein